MTLAGRDGTKLTANVLTPAGPGQHPGLVLVPGFGANDGQYREQAKRFAAEGFVTLTYTPRGFFTSGGVIDLAGPDDVADASAVIDWMLANTPTDPARIGMAGLSYGAGISLLVAAHDPRVRAVAALSPWADLQAAMVPNGTWSQESIAFLTALGVATGRPGPDMRAAVDAFVRNDRDAIPALTGVRSPATYLDALNANHPAVMMAAPWGDNIFPPGSLVDFFERLRLPKQMQVVQGDHATPEVGGLIGLPNETWDSAHRWLAHYVAGTANGVDSEPAVRVRPTFGGDWQGYPSWEGMATTTQRDFLGQHTLTQRPEPGWTDRILAGVDTVADGGVLEATAVLKQLGVPQPTWIPAVARVNAGVWQGPGAGAKLRGIPHLHLTVDTSAPRTTLIAYLYDVDQYGFGRLLTFQPYTLERTQHVVDIRFNPAVHDIPAGHHIAVVVDTVDPLFRSESRLGSTVTFTSPAADPSYLDIPLGR